MFGLEALQENFCLLNLPWLLFVFVRTLREIIRQSPPKQGAKKKDNIFF